MNRTLVTAIDCAATSRLIVRTNAQGRIKGQSIFQLPCICRWTHRCAEELVVIGGANLPDVEQEDRELRQVDSVADPRGHEESSPAKQPVQQACN